MKKELLKQFLFDFIIMKKIFLYIALTLSIVITAQVNDGNRYASQSVLSSGKWVKIAVANSGIHTLSYEDIKAIGLQPENIRIYGYGGGLLSEDFSTPYIDDLPEVPIFIQKGSDGEFNSGDYILFYAQATVSWHYNEAKGTFYHLRNHYSDHAYYFITDKAGQGKRIALAEAESGVETTTVKTFNDYLLHEQDIVNDTKGGREFYGELFNQSAQSHSWRIELSDIETQPAKMFVDMASKSTLANSINVSINGVSIKTIPLNRRSGNNYQVLETTSDTVTFTPNSDNVFEIKFTASNPSEEALLNYFEINFKRKLRIEQGELYFRHTGNLGKNEITRFVLANANADTEVWDITDKLAPRKMNTTLNGSQLTFNANTNTLRQFVAVATRGSFPKPMIIGDIANQNLHALPQADMIIIANRDFIAEANRLADYHRVKEGMAVNVVEELAIYNEFSSGTPDATAYRRLAKMFYDRSQTTGSRRPKWLLLFGDGLFDNRGIIPGGNPYRRLLTYQAYNSTNSIYAYTSDDYFGYLDDTDKAMNTAAQLDIAVGRLPVYTVEQAKTAVDKTISYIENNIRGEWKNRMLFVADDGDNNIHMRDCDEVAEFVCTQNPDVQIKKLYLDAFKQETSASTENYPLANNMFNNYIKQGVLLINYLGHGSYQGWANEKLLTTHKITSMINDKYPIFVTATCDFSAFDQFKESGGEQLIWNKTGGTMALITTTRVVYSNANFDLNHHLFDVIFDKDADGSPLSLGEILQMAKNRQTSSSNKFSFTLLGDPSLRLSYPYEAKVVTDSINHRPIDEANLDTISALSEITISGHIANHSGNKINGYDGVLFINVFDKKETLRTLANDKGSTPFEYSDRPNTIFRGSTGIADGKWSITFLVPKDIKYDFGQGLIYYYATENNLGIEANGSFEHFIVGGENSNPTLDNEGPNIKLYLNSRQFVQGQKVNSSPLFIADLYDQSGINTTGNGIGHDIILKKRKGDRHEIVLNDYYVSSFGDYRSGTVEYQIDNLEAGKYLMWFRAWDLQNNPSTAEIAFEVTDKIAVNANVTAYPNPATDYVVFAIEHDRPYKRLSATIRIYDIAGSLIAEKHQQNATTSNKTEIEWFFASEGVRVSKGIYFVSIAIAADGEKSSYKPIKLIVK